MKKEAIKIIIILACFISSIIILALASLSIYFFYYRSGSYKIPFNYNWKTSFDMSFKGGLDRTYYIYDNKVIERIKGKQLCASEDVTIYTYCYCTYGSDCEDMKHYKVVIKEYQNIDLNNFDKSTSGYDIYKRLENRTGKIIYKR